MGFRDRISNVIKTRRFQNKYICLIFSILMFICIRFFSNHIFIDSYMSYFARWNYYWMILIPIVLFIVVNKTNIAYAISFGNVAGLLIGQLLGDLLLYVNSYFVSSDMRPGEVEFLKTNQGIFIWFCCILISIYLALYYEYDKHV